MVGEKQYKSVQIPHLDHAIATGEWSQEALAELDNLINDIENGRKRFGRYDKNVLRGQFDGFRRSGRANEAATVILARTKDAGNPQSSDSLAKRKESPIKRFQRRQCEGRKQERIIEAWAKACGLWLNDYTDPDGNKADTLENLMDSQWDYIDGGSESKVYRYDTNTVIKSVNLSHYDGNLLMALDKFSLQNVLAPNAGLMVVGFGRDSLGHFQIIAFQPLIIGSELTNNEFNDFVSKQQIKEQNGWYNLGSFKITDLAPYNILKYRNLATNKDEFFIIDADYRLTEDEDKIDNGIYEVS